MCKREATNPVKCYWLNYDWCTGINEPRCPMNKFKNKMLCFPIYTCARIIDTTVTKKPKEIQNYTPVIDDRFAESFRLWASINSYIFKHLNKKDGKWKLKKVKK